MMNEEQEVSAKPEVSAGSDTGSSLQEFEKLKQNDYYHGYLPRLDAIHMLKKQGDFLVRISRSVKDDREREILISIRVEESSNGHAVRHYAIKFVGPEKYQVDKRTFASISKLLDFHIKEKEPLVENVPTSVLLNPIPRKKWELLSAEIQFEKELGSGQFGTVHRAIWKCPNKTKTVAVKCARTERITKEQVAALMRETRLMKNLNHPNIVKVYGVVLDDDPVMIVMELVKGGSLEDYFKRHKGKISIEEKVARMVNGAAWGLEYIHNKRIIHRDLAIRNTLYDRKKVLKISDFGLSREGTKYKMTCTRRVPIKWAAPEILTTYTYTPFSDVFSFGVMIWEIFTDGEEPFQEMKTAEIKNLLVEGHRLTFPKETPEEIRDLVKEHMWNQIPEHRMTMNEVVRKLHKITGLAAPTKKPKQPKSDHDDVSIESSRSRKAVAKGESTSYRRSRMIKPISSRSTVTPSSYSSVTSVNQSSATSLNQSSASSLNQPDPDAKEKD